MLYAMMSDVHANPWALETALADARAQGAEKFICLGDVVGYGPDAEGAVNLARQAFDVVLMGNHDAATAGVISSWNFRPEARAGVLRHAGELSGEQVRWLRELPFTHRARTFVAAHGSPAQAEEFPYITDVRSSCAALAAMGALPLSFVGHTHVSLWIASRPGRALEAERSDVLALEAGCRYIVNAGSVGYPRNEAESVYALYDSRRRSVVWRRLPFDYGRYFAAMERKNIYIAPWLRDNARRAANRTTDTDTKERKK